MRDLIDINPTYSRLHVLLGAIDDVPVETVRWLLLYSSFRGECGLVDLEKLRNEGDLEEAIERFDSETALCEAVVARLQLQAIDVGSGGNVS